MHPSTACQAHTTPVPSALLPIPWCSLGVAFSPCGNYVAAFSSDELYVARVYSVHRVGQLRHVAQLAGIKTVHWCPGSTALAVCCKQQVGRAAASAVEYSGTLVVLLMPF